MNDDSGNGAARLCSPVLVTGATGFIGREVVRRLLTLGRPVLAMARAGDGRSAADRVARAATAGAADGRLEVVEGDLTLPGCGLSMSDRGRLCESVETVIHCAGETDFFLAAMPPFRATHVDGPLELLAFLGGGRLRSWAHVSTAYVCGCRTGWVYEHEGDVGQEFHNPYERVKLEGEGAVREAGARLGVDVRVFRPSVAVGAEAETRGAAVSNLFVAFIRLMGALADGRDGGYLPLRIEGRPEAPFNIVPVEYVARALVALADHPEGAGKVFHLVASKPPTQAAVLSAITHRLGLHGVELLDGRSGPLADPSPLERKISRLLLGYREYLGQDVRFDDRNARRLLDRCSLPAPRLPLDVLNGLIDRALLREGPLAVRDRSRSGGEMHSAILGESAS
ncbi:MAG TPA: SDR family oxidoreductase [Candidatus Methylomirabilis sp.]|nr:SDR family oxidoreductase [Candidatus Methylomirabilis sp.]